MKHDGIKIRKIRIEKGLTQDFMAEKLGISQNSYWKIENNQTETKSPTIDKIADILETEKSKLLQTNEANTYNIEQHNHDSSRNGVIINQENFEKERQIWQTLEHSLRETITCQAETIKLQKEKIEGIEKLITSLQG